MIGNRDPEQIVREVKRQTRRKFSAEEKIRVVLEGLRGEETIAELFRREGISPNLYYNWSKEFLEAGKRRLAGNTKRDADSTEVTELRRENGQLKHPVVVSFPNIPSVFSPLRLQLREYSINGCSIFPFAPSTPA
jgi:transposase